MKIGIGCITYKRPLHLDLWRKQIQKHTEGAEIFIADDGLERKGVAYRSNECLRALKDCDFVFLFNDDCFPIRDGWTDRFIKSYRAHGQHHYLYLKETPTIKKTMYYFHEGIISFNNCAGCFMFLTKQVIEKVGAFDERFGIYGFEHANYSDRVHLAGLTPMGKYLCPTGAGEYIYSLDLDNHLPYNKQVKHQPSMKPKEAIEAIKTAQEHYSKVITEIYQPL